MSDIRPCVRWQTVRWIWRLAEGSDGWQSYIDVIDSDSQESVTDSQSKVGVSDATVNDSHATVEISNATVNEVTALNYDSYAAVGNSHLTVMQ